MRNTFKNTGRKVVVLIDEYDKPLIETMDNFDIILYAVYSVQSITMRSVKRWKASMAYIPNVLENKQKKHYQSLFYVFFQADWATNPCRIWQQKKM
ncbi:MAG: AAA family ATPase [Dysgonamonadaceae bacterium]|nr:AAA family ATPase [Dysgonamonadaceae bacterium]